MKQIKISGFIKFCQQYVNDLQLKKLAEIDSYSFAKEHILFKYSEQWPADQIEGINRIINVLEAETDVKLIFNEP